MFCIRGPGRRREYVVDNRSSEAYNTALSANHLFKRTFMKKKRKKNKEADMPEFDFKEFTPEESAVYETAVAKFREAVDAGKTLKEAYESYAVGDKQLEKLIQADFLKILIAERHFAGRLPLDEIARSLDISPTLVKETHARMLQEVGVTAASQTGEEFDGILPKPGTND
jgi:hypothetical protein